MATAKKTTSRKTATKATASGSTGTKATTTSATDGRTQGFAVPFGRIELPAVDVRALATDTAYATIGVGDLAVEVARELPQRLEQLRRARLERTAESVRAGVQANRARAERLVKEAPTRLQAELDKDLQVARKELDDFATRGRKLVESVSNAAATKRALAQTETARTQVKGAVTSVRKAVEQSQEAVGTAVQRLGRRRTA